MILQQLRLRNFRRFREVTIEFPENVIGIIGRNGAGKSTLLEAMAWALYGSRAARTEKHLIRSQQTSVTEPCEVELSFTVGGENYRVIRRMRGANEIIEAGLYRSGSTEVVAERESGVNEAIKKILGLDQRSFEVSIFAKQKELAALSTLTDEPRRKIVSRLINLEAIDVARQKVSAEALQKRKFVEGARATQTNLEELQNQLTCQKAQRDAAEKSLRQQQTEEQRLAKEREKARLLLEEESQRRDRFTQLNAELNSLRGQLQLVQQQQQQAENEKREILAQKEVMASLQPAWREWEKLKKEKETLEEQRHRHSELQGKQQLFRNLTEQMNALQSETSSLHQQLKALQPLAEQERELDRLMRRAQDELQNYRDEEKRLSNQLSVIEARGRDLKEKKERVQALGPESPCPLCTRPLAEHYEPVVAEFERSLTSLRNEYLKLTQEKKEATARLQEGEQKERSLQKQKEQLSAQREKLRLLQERLANQQKRIADLQQQCMNVQGEIQQLGVIHFDELRYGEVVSTLAELEKKVQELNHLEGRVANLPALEARLVQLQEKIHHLIEHEKSIAHDLEQLHYREEIFLAHKRAYDEASATHLQRQKQVGQAQAALAAAETEVKNIERLIAQAQEWAATIAQTEKDVTLLESLQEHFKVFRAEMAGRLRPLIATRASEILQMATNGRYSLMELDESYNIFLYDQNEKYALTRFSGGEQDLLNLCLRVAISQIIAQRSGRPPLQFIVLDEVFGSQDDQRKFLLLATLQNLSGYFRQIFLITHEESIKESLPVVFEVEMVGEASVVKMM
jgi:exonuclease SbcC